MLSGSSRAFRKAVSNDPPSPQETGDVEALYSGAVLPVPGSRGQDLPSRSAAPVAQEPMLRRYPRSQYPKARSATRYAWARPALVREERYDLARQLSRARASASALGVSKFARAAEGTLRNVRHPRL